MSKNLSYLSGRKGLDFNLFEQLGIASHESGSPDAGELEHLRKEFLFGKANIYGSVSFYDFLKEENKGKKIYLCNGSSCLTAGTQGALKIALLEHFSSVQIGEMCCLGRCHENSAFHYNGSNYSGRSHIKIGSLLNNSETFDESYHTKYLGTSVIMADYINCKEYYNVLIDCLKKEPSKLLEELEISGLRGRGGAGFPISLKLSACREAKGASKFIVCNADEGDPGAYSDRFILEQRPHAFLLGMMIVGYIAGAEWGVIYIRAEYPEAISIVQNAVNDLEAMGLTGSSLSGLDFHFRFKVIKAQGAYICGEETALLSSLEGQRPEVRIRPPYPVQKGLFNMPTLVNNVETLACIPYIMKNGGKKFSEIGQGKSTGTKLVSLDGYFNNPGIYEVEMGTPLKLIVENLGGGFREMVKAMHIGGPLGGLVPVTKIDELTLDFESFSENGFLLGHASIICIPDSFPLIEYIKHLFQFTAHESCGKCFPCRLGSIRGYEMLEKATNSDYKIDFELMNDLLETLEIGSLCALGGGLPLPVKNALKYFAPELKQYFSDDSI